MERFDEKVKAVLKKQCEESFEYFVRYIFKGFMGFSFNTKPFHQTLFKTFEEIYEGKHKRVIINIPPRHSKTEMSKMFAAWVLARNPKAKSLVLSYSSTLAEDNSSYIRDYVSSDAFQDLWPMTLKSDAKGKSHWKTVEGGEVYGTAAGGQVTGFGAGLDGQGCKGGLILIDDPLKPDDAQYETRRGNVNENFNRTIKSRRNDVGVPIVIIMQRIHEEDLSGFLLDGGDGEEWHHVKVPVWDENKEVIWPERYSQAEAEIANKSQPYHFAGQYLQEPAPLEGGMWKKDWFELINKNDLPGGIRWELFVDGAYTKDTKNDPTGLMIAGKTDSNKTTYLLHNESKWLEMPELLNHIEKLVRAFNIKIVLAEPKASGKSLVQMLRARGVPAAEIKSRWMQKSKIDKANDVAPFIEGGKFKLVKADWNPTYLHEVATFPNAKHDEAVDNTAYAIERLQMRKKRILHT